MTRLWPERWVPVLGSPRYEVSDRGNIRRAGRPNLSPAANDCGYLKVTLYGEKIQRQVYVHRMVLISHVGPPPDDGDVWTVDHIDFDLRNNMLDNLRWLTLEQNSARHSPAELDAWWGRQRHRRRKTDTELAAAAQLVRKAFAA